ncbi:hypothetical protein HMPREF1222_02434 [Treponema vincentii F0403]|uniref:Saccharopine dehydrogenase NADP binding domain-containing protein n=1 Tax=Treponema vincentii F0403 TaxID=1125702 RepID=S3M9T8_9SPIR|nr:saccharopine dehydrogenase NADP-binding domain-containing protein [Treponema vincentii]EPF45804.1 hypothetical protein HMPREF1222_02434 [Treponema vincentii F0403]
MKDLVERLKCVEKHTKENNITIMIIGLGSVGAYLLDYLVSKNDPSINIVVVGRDFNKMETKVNIIKISALIRQLNKSIIRIEADVDLNNIESIQRTIEKYKPDFIVNSSRAYSGLKYGSISWANVRAYGIWTPLAIRFTKNIMDACDKADTNAVVINTSYSDAVIPWLKSAGRSYPDFGSGNLNHLIPRMKFAVADMLGINDFWNVNIIFAAGHFHDVCISKEGQDENIKLPLKVYYKDEEQKISVEKLYQACKISMPVDQTRNMMNASSNYNIITAVIEAIRSGKSQRVFIPGAFGNIGGYPVLIGYKNDLLTAWIDESVFTFKEMDTANRASMYLDGIENIVDGKLIYTDELIKKSVKAFHTELPKTVAYDDIDQTAQFLIDKIILPNTQV